MTDLTLLDSVFEFSPSAVKKWRKCRMSYYFSYALKLKEPQGAAAALGTRIHTEMENWLLKQEVPTIKAAKRLLPLAPHPNHPGLLVERAWRVLYPMGAARGFIDLLIPKPVLKYLPDNDFSPDIPIVMDWKSTRNLDYALSPEELVLDPQGVLYGVAARIEAGKSLEAVPDVDLVWNYTSTKSDDAFPVKARQSLQILEDGLGPLLDDARQMSDMCAAKPDPGSIEYDLRACEMGRYVCSHARYCPAYAGYHRKRPEPIPEVTETETPVSSILDKLQAAARAPMTSTPALAPATPAESTGIVKPSPEPSLPKPDTSGLDVPPPGPIAVLPPDAAPNLTPETAAGLGTEVVSKAKVKKPRKSKTKAPVSGDLLGTIEAALLQAVSERRGSIIVPLAEAFVGAVYAAGSVPELAESEVEAEGIEGEIVDE